MILEAAVLDVCPGPEQVFEATFAETQEIITGFACE